VPFHNIAYATGCGGHRASLTSGMLSGYRAGGLFQRSGKP